MTETKVAFKPIRCLESDLDGITPVDGHVAFTTDTRKIFAVIDGEFKMMGGSSGIYYGLKILTDEEKYGEQVIFSFLPTDIDGDELPAEDDLILNISDGGFYRVLKVNDIDIQTQRIAISGGGSGGGTGPDTPANEGLLTINYTDETPKKSSTITGVPYYIEFDVSATDSAGDPVDSKGTATWIIGGKTYIQTGIVHGRNSFRVDEYLNPADGGDGTKIIVSLTMNTGGVNDNFTTKTWYVKAVDLALEWNYEYNSFSYIRGDTFTLKWKSYGGVNCTAHIVFDDIYNPGVTYFTKDHMATGVGETVSDPMPSLSYGPHKCEIYLTTQVNGQTYRTDSIVNEITFVKDSTSTILTVPYYETQATQYDTLKIPFMIYDPDLNSCEVEFYLDDNFISSKIYATETLHDWPYTITTHGSVKLTIKTANDEAQKDIYLVVNELDINAKEVTDYAFALKANNLSTNDELKDWQNNKDLKGISLTFSDGVNDEYQPFDWENGGVKFDEKSDGSIEKYICIRKGTRMTINYNLFGRDAAEVSRDGKTFKICFKVMNCYDYEAPFLECYDDRSKVGLKMDAQKTIFSTLSNQNFDTQYCENSYVELEAEIWPDATDKDENFLGDRYLMLWVDGVPVACSTFSEKESFKHTTNNTRAITIGSDECDTYIYLIKAYERRLTEGDHLNNFIMDAPTSTEMLSRYHRNDILDDVGQISCEKLVQKNPDCHAYVYRIPYMTKSKNDKVGNCDYLELYGEYNTINNPYYKAINEKGKGARIRVQGTSSAAYGVAAFNLRTEFQEGLLDKDGNKVDGWVSSDTAIPIDYVCTKVNVASCENANNVVNAEWYNKFQPYHDGHRRKIREDGKEYRDCMAFNSGVVFVLDENTETNYIVDGKPSSTAYTEANVFLDTRNYTSRPYYKQYAIGNMGNDKKNVEIFHDTTNPKACCVENCNNQREEQRMIINVDRTLWEPDEKGDYIFEFRYPDGNKEATDEMKDAFELLVNWMADNNPNNVQEDYILTAERVVVTENTYRPNTYYTFNIAEGIYTIASGAFDSSENYYKIIPAAEGVGVTVVFEPYTFKGFDPPGYEGTANPTGISLKGQTVTDYAGSYSKDSYNYRMAKMLAECEEHLVMDSIVYHYLFIQRHTMVDNVAKNTFWSSEDLIHWDLTKNYDNDTSDGNNNSGYLTFGYGVEILDTNENGDDIWNGAPSTWLHFIHGLKSAQRYLYKELQLKGAWNAADYLEEFKKHQNIIPERCWIYDYFRKYIRPRQLGLDKDGNYIKRLEGGKKVHQRNQYETYQDFYMNSKYFCGTDFTSPTTAIDLRLNYAKTDVWDKNNIIPVSYYIDCYACAEIGGVSDQSDTRIKRKTKYNFPIGTMISDPGDATCWFFGSKMIQSLEELQNVRPSYVTLNNAHKLGVLQLGSDAEGYHNYNLTSAGINGSLMLQKAYIQNCGVATGMQPITIPNLFQLEELYLNGSTTTELQLPKGGVIKNLYLNPLSILKMEDLEKLSDVRLDEGIYDTLASVSIKNCPAMDSYSYQLALRAPIISYTLTDFNWTITNIDDLVVENNEIVGIKVLDKLLEEAEPIEGATKTALVGTITIDVDTNILLNEYNLYCKYVDENKYPNVIIRYTDKVTGLVPAAELIFLTNNEDGEVHYRVLANKVASNITIGQLISENGPTKVAMTYPTRQSTGDTVYSFTGYWIDNQDNKYYYHPELVDSPIEGAENFNTFVPIDSMTFYPKFDEDVRTYEIQFKDWDNNIILQNGSNSWEVPCDSTYKDAGGPILNYYYRDSGDLPQNKRYAFKGWSTSKFEPDKGNNVEFIDLSADLISKALTLYPYYETEDVRSVATSEEYFTITSTGVISVREGYKSTLAGKITIPTKLKNDAGNMIEVTAIGSMGENKYETNSEITHVYFLSDSKASAVNANAFAYCNHLQVVDLPKTIRTIGSSSFVMCEALTTVTLNDNITAISDGAFSGCKKLEINSLPSQLTTLGASAFQSCGEGIRLTSLPSGVTTLGNFTFSPCSNVKLIDLSGIKKIGAGCFDGAGNGITSLVIGEQVEFVLKIGEYSFPPFTNYGKGTLSAVYFKGAEEDYPTMAQLGFAVEVNPTYGYDPSV